MLDLLIKLILYLSLQYSINEKGQLQMTESELTRLKSSQEFIEAGSPSISDIQVISEAAPESDIVTVPDIDPKAVK